MFRTAEEIAEYLEKRPASEWLSRERDILQHVHRLYHAYLVSIDPAASLEEKKVAQYDANLVMNSLNALGLGRGTP